MSEATALDHDAQSSYGPQRSNQALQSAMASHGGDAASPAAISRLSKALAGSGTSKTDRKAAEVLKTAIAAVRVSDFETGARRAMRVLQADSRNGSAWHVLAICQEKTGALPQALTSYEAALKLMPDNSAITHDLGRLALLMGLLDIAEMLLQKFLAIEPGHVEATNNLACVYRDQERYDDAVETLRSLLEIEPGSALLWNTLGAVLSDQGRTRESLIFFNEALRLAPGMANALHNRANARQVLDDKEGALQDIEAALPAATAGYEQAMMAMTRSMVLLALGRLKEGFDAYEARLHPLIAKNTQFVADCPRWDPATQDIAGKRLLVMGEQGIADEMVFGGTLQDIIDAVGPEGQVYVAVDPRLIDMYQRSFPAALFGGHRTGQLKGRLARFAPFIGDIASPDAKPGVWTPMASLMALYRTDVSAFPIGQPYLIPDPARVAHWQVELEKLGPGFKVGLHWKSSLLKGVRTRYFSGLETWQPVLTAPGCIMVNLQCGDVDDELAEAKEKGISIWTPPIDLREDLEDLAALSNALDLVIGPPIAGAVIAAATGARTWLIYPPDDWRLLGQDHYPFFPGARVFATRSFDGWPQALSAVRQALDEEVAAKA